MPSVRNLLREKCLYSELFGSVFSRIQTENGEILSNSQSKCRELQTRITPITETFLRNELNQKNQQNFRKCRVAFTIVKMIIMKKIDYILKMLVLKITIMKVTTILLIVAKLKIAKPKGQESPTKVNQHSFQVTAW